MIRLNFPLRRLPKLSRADFQKYWREQHGPLVAGVARTPRIRRYVQSHTVDDALYDGLRAARTGMHEPFDGVASLWWDSREDLLAGMSDDAARRAGALLLEDERRFIGLAHSPLWVGQELAQINPMGENSIVAWPQSSWIKFCYLLQPKPGMTQAACHKTWNMEHGYLIRRHSQATRFARYIQTHTLDDELNDAFRAAGSATRWPSALPAQAPLARRHDARRLRAQRASRAAGRADPTTACASGPLPRRARTRRGRPRRDLR